MNFIYNPEIKTMTIKLIFVQILFSLIMFFVMSAYIDNLNDKIIDTNSAIVGKLLSNHPEFEDEIISYITHKITNEELVFGENILNTYGYSKQLSMMENPTLNRQFNNMRIQISLIIVAFGIPLIIIIGAEYKKIYDKVREISQASEKVVEGDFNCILSDVNEGEFGILNLRFNQMSNRLKITLDKLKDDKQFLKNIIQDISHQLKTPLSSIIMFNELMINKKDMDEITRDNFLLRTQIELNKMEWLIISLLKLARLEAGAITFKQNKEKLRIAVKKAVGTISLKAENKKQTINIEEQNENIMFIGDIDWMAEALTNIIKNSIEHTNEYGKIEVLISESSVLSRIIIRDNGEGIEEKDLPHIFKRFYRGNNQVESEGVGIGLALAKTIIEGLNGSIIVRSQKGKGTEFEIVFLKGVV